MDSQKVDMFLMSNNKFFPPENLTLIKAQLEKMDDSKFLMINSMSYKDPTMLLIISILAGHIGIDRFMLGETGLGVAKLLTCGGLGIWAIIDWFIIMGKTREINFQRFLQACG